MSKVMQWAIARILDIAGADFYGSITLKFEAGQVVRIEHHHSEKPPAMG